MQKQLKDLLKAEPVRVSSSFSYLQKVTAMHRDDVSENSTHLRTKDSSGVNSGGGAEGSAAMEKPQPTNDTGLSRRGKHMIEMPPSFVPGVNHVICAKGKEAKEHPANRKLKVLVNASLDRYSACPSKLERSFIVSKILATIRQGEDADLNNIDNVPTDAVPSSEATAESFLKGGFVRQVQGKWYEVGDRNAREKIGQAFRDSLHTQFRSSTKAKASIRKHHSSSIEQDSTSLSQSNASTGRRCSSQLSSPSTAKRKMVPSKSKATTKKSQRKRQKKQQDVFSSQDGFPVSEVSFDKSPDSQKGGTMPMPHLHLQQPLPHPDSFVSSSSQSNKQRSPPVNQKDLEPLPLSQEVEESHATHGRQYARQDSMSTIGGGSYSRQNSLTAQIMSGSLRSSLLQDTDLGRRHSLSLPQPMMNSTINMNGLYSHMSLSAQSASSLMRGLASSREVSASTGSTRVPRPDPPARASFSTHIALPPELVSSSMANTTLASEMNHMHSAARRNSLTANDDGATMINNNPMLHMNHPNNLSSSQFLAYQQFAQQHNQHATIMQTMNNSSHSYPVIMVPNNANIDTQHAPGTSHNNNNTMLTDGRMNMRTILHDNLLHNHNRVDSLSSSNANNGLVGNDMAGRLEDGVVDHQKQWKQQFE